MLASLVTILKHAALFTTSTSSAAWESDNFKMLFADDEDRVLLLVFFCSEKLNIVQDRLSDTRVM